MKSSPTKKNHRVRHVWWWPWLLLKASFNCPLQSPSRFFFTVQNCDLFTLPYFKQNIKGICHNVCNHSQCPFFHTKHTHTHIHIQTNTQAQTHMRAHPGDFQTNTPPPTHKPSIATGCEPRDEPTFHTGLLTFTQINWELRLLTHTHTTTTTLCYCLTKHTTAAASSHNQLSQQLPASGGGGGGAQ